MPTNKEIYTLYKTQRQQSILYKSNLKIFVIILLVGYYVFSDIVLRGKLEWAYFRLITLVPAFIYLILRQTKLNKNKSLMVFIFHLVLSSMLFMLFGMNTLSYQTEFFTSSVLGIMLVIVVIFMAAKANIKEISIIYFVPLISFIIYHQLYETGITKKEILDFINPVVVLISSIVISHVQEKLRFKEFKAKHELALEKAKTETLYKEVENKSIKLEEQNQLLKEKNIEIQKQSQKIHSQHHDLVKHTQKISDSITYAKSLQHSVLPDEKSIKKLFSDIFILYMPKDIVGGDFYWINKVDNKTIVISADCTGHGVPGAIMSMLGIAHLNEIILRNRITDSGIILNQLRAAIKTAFYQQSMNMSFDGIVAGVAVIDYEKNSLYYSGAYNSLVHFNNEEFNCVKGDKQPVALYSKESPFTTSIVENIQANTSFYMFSDGYQDQINKETKKKFMKNRVRELLKNIQDKPMEKQKQILLEEHNKWKKGMDQIDDILFIGFRI